ncbi:MAG: NAD(P)H-dependent oxidoreductase [Faecalicoccus sp.]|nr:NAD(P)H-dependent oxidoreductase [Faecalicoccus sp.]
MKKIISTLLCFAMLITLAACGSSNSAQNTSNAPKPEVTGNILVVYFSWSGHLESMAGWIADETGGDLYRVTAKEEYPQNYNETADRAKKEQDDGVRPEINVDLTQEQIDGYDVIFFGFPVWWYDLPMSMWTFLESYDFSGKTIIPFFSHEGSSNGANALPTVESLAKGATVYSQSALSIRGGSVASSENEVREWVRSFEN